MRCAACPTAAGERCLGDEGRTTFCGWAASGLPHLVMTVRDRNRLPDPAPVPPELAPAPEPRVPAPALDLAVLRRAARCWFRINPRSCCDGVTCHLRGTWVDPARDCRDCDELPP